MRLFYRTSRHAAPSKSSLKSNGRPTQRPARREIFRRQHHRHHLSGAQVLAEYYNNAAPSSPTNEYIYAGSLKVASIQSGTTNFWHNDHLSPRVRTDTSGNVSDQRGTFPFGESWYSPSGAPYLFTTYYRDSESANDYAQARYNVSGLGRFASPDPIPGSTSDPQSLNRYSYVRNMPHMLTDPFGTCPGGLAENRDPNQQQNTDRAGGPFQPDSDPEEAQANQTPGIQWIRPPGPCPGFTDQGGGGGPTTFTTLDNEDIGQIPSGLMGVPTVPGVPNSGSNDTYYLWGLGFGPGGENGPFGMYSDPTTEGCYGSSASGITCTDNGPIPGTAGGLNGQPLQFSQVFGQTDFPPVPTWGMLTPDVSSPGTFPPPKLILPKAPGNPPPGPGNGPPNPPPCRPTPLTVPGTTGATPGVPASGILFFALLNGTPFQTLPGLACSR